MRFFNDGPSIPDLLLEQRDQGRVIFLCGAGVSLNSGMPTFTALTKHVMEFFDPPEEAQLTSSFRPWLEKSEAPKTPLDQIFHLLYQEYGRDDVNALVAERLQAGNSIKTESIEHKIISRISADQEGNPQVVTTNFDRLFEQTLVKVTGNIHEPPSFPDINLGVPLTGITYLHGRIQEPKTKQHPYVLSSADFGRAYLSEGWATNFIRSLLKNYTVVLIGYQAEDPPVKYLLQGLNHDGLSDRSNLYAFDMGIPEEIEAKWRDRGVTSIAYKDHPQLCRSLEAWAERAVDPRLWRSKIIELAMKNPRQVEAHERGQVTHLVRTTSGARLFANTEPSPPAEWLCVFDASCRAAKKSKTFGNDEPFYPLEEYGLDDDPPLPSDSEQNTHNKHDHIFEWRRSDTNPPTFHRLCNRQPTGSEDMPSRLFYLSKWIAKNFDSPTTAWWAFRQDRLHPKLANEIHWKLKRETKLHPETKRIWNLIYEYHSDNRNLFYNDGWYDLKDRITNEGWSTNVLRYFEITTAPILTRNPPLGNNASKPPLECWAKTSADELPSWHVKFPNQHGEKIDIPDEMLTSVFRILEANFFRATALLEETKTNYFTTPTCYPEREVEGEDFEPDATFMWFLELFSRMITHHPDMALAHAIIWPITDKYYFKKFKLFALNNTKLFQADEAAEIISTLAQEHFWDSQISRELLFLISDRWENFSNKNKIELANRLLNGPEKMSHWSEDEYSKIRREWASRYSRWLTLQGCALTHEQTVHLSDMISQIPDWNEHWAVNFTTKHHGSFGCVGTDDTPDTIINIPVNKIIEQATVDLKRDFEGLTEKRPFTGLVRENPRKALAALTCSARKNKYPQTFWSALISEWPEETKPRLFRVFLHRLFRLPNTTIRELRYEVGRWIENRFLLAFNFDKELAWGTFDHLVSGLTSEDGIATKSGLGERRINNETVERSRRTVSYASYGPIGNATEGLIRALNALNLDQGQEIPEEIKSRLEQLVSSLGEGGDHAIAILTQQISWLYYLDPQWVQKQIMPWFSFEHPASEPAWNGYLSAARFLPQEVGTKLKPLLLELFPTIYQWSWDRDLAKIAVQMIVELAVFREDKSDGISTKEARRCLRNMNDKNRQDAVFWLGKIGQRDEKNWLPKVIPFINTTWPRERKLRTSTLVSSWVSLLAGTGNDFPIVLSAVRRFLVPVQGERHWLNSLSRETKREPPLTARYPDAVLELLDAVIPNSTEDIPYNLEQVLALIEETDSGLVRDRRFLRLINLIEQT